MSDLAKDIKFCLDLNQLYFIYKDDERRLKAAAELVQLGGYRMEVDPDGIIVRSTYHD